jgi:hypothetical protein
LPADGCLGFSMASFPISHPVTLLFKLDQFAICVGEPTFSIKCDTL